jgi:aminopeptidase N
MYPAGFGFHRAGPLTSIPRAMSATTYRYNRSDFGPLPVRLEHMDIYLNFADGRVEGTNVLRMTAQQDLRSLRLDARDLEVKAVEWGGEGGRPVPFRAERENAALWVDPPHPLQAGQTFTLRTRTVCVPSANLLEGIYLDTTPRGCPQQYMSQCQQWGFQRILPVIDDCRAKCTYVTTLEADARYTHLISNGEVVRTRNPDGVPVHKPGDPSRKVITFENRIPMAPYLFIACVGTWDVLEDSVQLPDGRRIRLEYLVPPGRREGAVIPMRILKEAVLWQARAQEYTYERDVYRTICMEKSNYGGMENVGNTTIVTAAALVDEYTTDVRLQYAYGVIVHEFEHNQCGSDVTMETPFDMWLNEAFTVDVERQFMRNQFSPAAQRLEEVDRIRAPLTGPLAVEDAGHLGNIVRQGFNNPDELVDGLTYVKAAEVIRMLRLILGNETFRRGKNLYFKRYKAGNANTDQFFACFEEVSGRDLSGYKQEWLHTIGYPVVEGRWSYDDKTHTLRLALTQTRTGKGGWFLLPVEVSAVDARGQDIPGTQRTVEVTGDRVEVEIPGVPEPEYVSWNRNASFYGIFSAPVTPATLVAQVRTDPCEFNRVEAMRQLTDIERVRLLKDPAAALGGDWLEVYGMILRDPGVHAGLKAHLLHIDEQSLDRQYVPWYRERNAARFAMLRQVAARHMGDLIRTFRATDTYRRSVVPKEGMDERRLKTGLLRAIVEANSLNAQAIAEEHFRKAWHISDKLGALACIQASRHTRRRDLMEEGYRLWKDHHAAYSSYLSLVGTGREDDVFDMIEGEERRPTFNLHHPSHTRALYGSLAHNNKMVWTDRGIRWVAETVRKLTPVNEYVTLQVLACFQQVRNLAPDLKPKVIESLRAIQDGVDAVAYPSVAGRVAAYLRDA